MSVASRRQWGWAAGLWLVLPNVALACPVCFVAQSEENRLAYVVSSIGLTLMPFVIVGGMLFWVVRRVRAADAAALDARERLIEPAE